MKLVIAAVGAGLVAAAFLLGVLVGWGWRDYDEWLHRQ